jgi:hypothetical protein
MKYQYFAESTINDKITNAIFDDNSNLKYIRWEEDEMTGKGYFRFIAVKSLITVIFEGDSISRMYYKDSEMNGGSRDGIVLGHIISVLSNHNKYITNPKDEEYSICNKVNNKIRAYFHKLEEVYGTCYDVTDLLDDEEN